MEAVDSLCRQIDHESVNILTQYACNEHLDEVTFAVIIQVIAINLFKIAIGSSIDQLLNEDKEEIEIAKPLAYTLRRIILQMKEGVAVIPGYSEKGKSRMISRLREEIASCYSSHFEFYSTGVDYIIKDGNIKEEEKRIV